MCRDAEKTRPEPAEPAVLCAAGLSAYREAITYGSASGDVPQCVRELGLLRPHGDEPDVYVPVPPDVAAHQLAHPVERTLLEGQQWLLALRDAFSPAEKLYREERQLAVAPIRLLREPDVIVDTLRKLSRSCRREFQAAQPGGPRDPVRLAKTLPAMLALVGRGVQYRTLYQHSVRTHGPTLDFMVEVHAAGGQFRTLDELFGRMIIYDRSVAVVPDQRYSLAHHALLIDHPGIVGFLAEVFDHAWARAERVGFDVPHARPAPLTDEKRRTVLRLMVEGHTDAAIASRLGMSTRTVSNHMRRAADEFGSRSRAQLAYLLAKSGLLD
ncbi:LuxR C-terminal-related transcriptional regulator [Streptomyces flavidovirens]|uniref:LuxR C-terminal-related transcriptional regulator n=1 Tax=Streptomyces flavidovirens TaxID=67298 RepID=UPI00368A396A